MIAIESQFEPIAKEYAEFEANPDLSRYELVTNWHSIEAMLPKSPARVMDYGCGSGVYSQRMQEQGYDVLAVDNSQTMLDTIEAPDLKMQRWSYQETPPDGQFDAVVAKLVVHFVEDLPGFAQAMSTLLINKGDLIISVPNPVKSRRFIKQQNTAREYIDEMGASNLKVHMIHRDFDEYERVMTAAGLQFLKADSPRDPATPQAPSRRLNMLFRRIR